MASLIANCLARLVKEGRVTPKQAKDAQALHDGMQGRLGADMGVASSEAVAALQAAKVMGEQARLRKVSIGKNAIAYQSAADRIAAHPRGKVAGLQALLTRDIFESGTATAANVDSKTEAIFGKLDGMFSAGNEALGVKMAGFRQDKALAENVIRENFGQDTGNQSAKEISGAWKAVTDYAANRAKLAGKLFSINEDWRQPQFWQADRVQKFGEAQFTADVANAMRSGGLQVFDKETGAAATPMKLPAVLHSSYHDITTGGGKGGGGMGFSPDMRVFRFASGQPGADAYLNLMGKYGPGRDLYPMMHQHLQSSAREIALSEQLGPQYASNFRALHADAAAAEKAGQTRSIPVLSTAYGAQKTFDMMTGKLSTVANETLAGIASGVRGWMSAVQLGGALLSTMPGDHAAIALASGYNGMNAGRILASAWKGMAVDSEADRALAARLGIVASAAADSALTQARYADQWLGKNFGGKAANFTIRAGLLQAWTESAKRAVTMEMMGWLADNAAHAYADVTPPFQRFLDIHGISPDEWETMRAAPPLEAQGAKFFDTSAIGDQGLADKLMSAVIDERHFFLIAPTSYERGLITPNAQRGTIVGELGRSAGMYKSWTMSLTTTHLMRMVMQDTPLDRVGYFLKLAGLTTMFGAAAVGAKDIVAGKDPRRMNTPQFWSQAMLQGGGLGILGDLIGQGFTRAGTGLAGTLGGPLVSAIDDGSQLIFPSVAKAVSGQPDQTFGATLVGEMRKYMLPNLFYTRVALDRLFFDQVQTMIDPKYQQSFAAQASAAKKSGSQQFWWKPGTGTPQRPPNLGNVYQ